MKQAGIYKIQSIIKPERIYIGNSCNIKKRWRCHLEDLRNNKHHSSKLQNHFNKYGESDLQFNVLIGCEESELVKYEQFFIDSLNPFFNISPTAGSLLGHKIPNEVKKKMSLAHLGRKKSEETKRKMSVAQKGNKRCLGRIWSEESKLKISKANKGKKRSIESRKKMSESQIGHIPWNKGKRGEYTFKRKPFTEEHRKNLSESHKGHVPWNKGKKIAGNKILKAA